MAISLENVLRNALHEHELRHDYAIATDTVRAIIDLYKENDKRYFIVSYSGKINSNIFVGFTDFSTDGCFLNFKTTVEQIKERQGIKECVITNIMEISEQDFNDWIN